MIIRLVVDDRDHDVHIEPGDDDGSFHVTVDHEPFEVRLVRNDKGVECHVGDDRFELERHGRVLMLDGERVDVGVRHLGQAELGAGHGAGGELRPPMPGRIVEVLVGEGDTVTRGQPLVVLEAMKMHNEITAPGDATVVEVRVKEGDAVEATDVLVVLG